MNLNTALGAAAIAALPLAGHAATLSTDSQLDIVGSLDRDNSSFESGGQIDFENVPSFAERATNDFSSIVTNDEAFGTPDDPTAFTLYDIDFATPGKIYEGGGFSFIAESFGSFDNDFPGRSFVARGVITSDDFDDTPGTFSLSTQGTGQEAGTLVSFSSTTTPVPVPAAGLLLLGGLGGLAALRRRK